MTQKAATHAGLNVSGKQMFQWAAKNFVGGVGGFFFPVETSSAVCRRAGNSAEWLEQGSYPAVWLQAGALLSFCAPPVPLWWWFFWHRQTRLCQMPRAHRTCSRVVVLRG